MSKKRTNVKYSLFMSSPVSPKSSKNKDFFIKGDKDNTFELKKGHDNIYIVKTSDGKRFEFDRNSFLSTLKDLKKYSHNPIKTLEEEQNDSFAKIMNAIEMLYKTGKLYELIHNDIHTIFDDVKIVIPGTIAAYFIGCSSNDNFPGPMGCNPRCAASLAPGGKDPAQYTCDDLVLMYEDDKTFTSLNRKISSHSYIHIGDPNFKGFTEENIKKLNEANISSVTLIYAKSDGTYGDIVGSVPIEKLPLLSQTQNDTNNNNDDGAWILFIIIIAIAIILLLIVLYQLYDNRNF
jgi:hypothetical protein